METDGDHIHCMLQRAPTIRLNDFVRTLKSYTAYHPYGRRTRDGWSRGSIVTARSGRTVISSPQSARSAPKHSKTLHRRPGKRTDPDILQHGFQSRKPKLAGFCATQSIKSRLPQPTCTPVVPMRASQYRLTIISATAQRNLIEFLAKTEGRRWPRSQ